MDPSELKGARRTSRLPGFVQPELATLVKQAPQGGGWLHEIKFDGYRAVSRIENGSVTMYSRNDKDWTDRFRVIADELAVLPVASAILDGEVVVCLPDGRTSFQELQTELGVAGAGDGPEAREQSRLQYYVFDLLYLDGYDLLGVAIEDRKELLRRLVPDTGGTGRILHSEHIPGEGPAVLEQACRMGLEGIVSKKTSTPYRPGLRGREWVKTKCRSAQEFVIGGYTDPAGARTGFGALLLGVHGDRGLRYAGKVGTGFDERLLEGLAARLATLRTDHSPFVEGLEKAQKNAHWVIPELVAEVEFAEWTRDGGLRHPSFKGLREDKAVTDLVTEVPADTAVVLPAGTTTGDAPLEARYVVNGVGITHPARVFWPLPQITKMGLVEYYDTVCERMLPFVIDRPIAMVRCPSGVDGEGEQARRQRGKPAGCFFNKHPGEDFPGPVGRVMITESGGPAPYLTITGRGSLTALAQMGVLEIHIWGSTWPDIEHPDMLVFDLDPGPGVSWPALADGARLVRKVLRSTGLESFVKTTGGKGLHVVVPLTPGEGWKEVSQFCRRVAETVVDLAPDRFTANMAKAKRQGRIYVDYVRNNRGATAIAPFSTRAKERAAVAVPLKWSELSGSIRSDTYSVEDLSRRLSRLKSDPWDGYFETRGAQKLDAKVRRAIGLT